MAWKKEGLNMSDEDGEEMMKRKNEEHGCKRADPDDYGRLVLKMAVAQICQAVGFQGVKQSVFEALSQLVVQYISDLGKLATLNANLAARSESNVFDILKGLQDFETPSPTTFLFSGSGSGSDYRSRCAISSHIVKQLSEFFNSVEEIPFAQPIPRFPVTLIKFPGRNNIQTPSFLEMGENPGGKHIPDWLPAFPDAHTYMKTPMWSQRKLDLRIDKGEQARQRRKAERSLLNLQQRLLSNALGSHVNDGDKGNYVGAPVQDNMSLAQTLPPVPGNDNGGRERKSALVKETFAPAIEALKAGGNDRVLDSDAMDIDKRVVSQKRRPVVHFKLKAGKKMLVEDLDIHLRNMINDKRGSLIGRDDDKDDKKRRAEFILRQSLMDNPPELSQM